MSLHDLETAEYHDDGCSTAEPRAGDGAGRRAAHADGQMRGFRRASPEGERFVRDMLRQRLRVSTGVIGFVYAVLLLMQITKTSDPILSLVATPVGLGLMGAVVAISAAAATALTLRNDLSLSSLRRVELVSFGILAVYIVFFRYTAFTADRPGGFEGPAHEDLSLKLSAAIALIQEILTLCYYGVFIPNTWRRCLGVCCVFVAMLLAATVAAGASGERVAAQVSFLLTISAVNWLAAAVLAAYGSYRINTLQKEVFDARRIGQYTLRQRLGHGGMGEVYLAEHALLRRPSAVKLIRPDRVDDPSLLLRFEREAQTTATLTHPNTVQIYDYGLADDGTFYYVMEYLPGLTLDQLVRKYGPLPPGRALHLLRQVCGALREAHSVGLIHRDIKPGNIMVCQRGGLHDVAKLLDFGLVLPRNTLQEDVKITQDGSITGTPAYMSPEQIEGDQGLDPRSDIYSLGAVAYCLLTGRPPFASRSSVKVMAAHLYEQPQPLTKHSPNVPADLEALVIRCLAKNPTDRFENTAALEMALAGCRDRWSAQDAENWWHLHSQRAGSTGKPAPVDTAPSSSVPSSG